ncbi:PIG-L deacetylase family protein [Streptomyces rubradiris]|uniref:PIG-L deacetylase family protein n=1 Tax=Streptomyces rubradiris TaxID=285531 RepID=UPI0036E3DE57
MTDHPVERVLAVAAHADDEILGAGGTLAVHRAAGHPVMLLILSKPKFAPCSPKRPTCSPPTSDRAATPATAAPPSCTVSTWPAPTSSPATPRPPPPSLPT